jgi:hypothetical protein
MDKDISGGETIGCDLGDKKSDLCVLDAQGNVTHRAAVQTTRKAVTTWFAGHRRM